MSAIVGESAPSPESGGLFLLRVNFVLLTTVVTAVLALAISVVLFRELGAEGKGRYSLFTLAVTIGSGVCTLGVGLANVYFLGRRRYPLNALLAGSEFLVISVVVLIVAGIAAISLTGLDDRLAPGVSIWWFALAIPAALQLALVAPVLQARNQFTALNLAAALIPGGTAIGLGLLAAIGEVSTERAILLWVASYLAANVVAISAIGWGTFAGSFAFLRHLPVFRDQVRFGMQGEFGNLLQLVNYRFDLFIVAAYKNTTAVGFYSIAVAAAESLWLISGAVIIVLTPRLSSAGDDEAANFGAFVCRTVLLVNMLLALAIAAVSPFLIELVFGAAANRAVIPTLLLLPGVVALSGNMVLASYIFSRGRPILNTYSTAVTVGLTLLLDLALIPALGIEGAAVASSVAYVSTFAISLFWFRRLSGRSVWDALVVRPASDVRSYRAILREATRRVGHAVARGA